MKPGGGRSKGNGYENRIAKEVIAAFACFGIKRKDCYRTPGSGGHRFAKKKDPGDLVISPKLRKMFPFSVECKFYKKVKLWALWWPVEDQKKSWRFRPWIRQARKAAKGTKLIPLLVFKENNGPDMAAFPATDAAWQLGFKKFATPFLRTRWHNQTWMVVLLEDVLIACVENERRRRKENVH